jgi:TATA-box binding protein (TBP) (component of TFIID and TFIIIB)
MLHMADRGVPPRTLREQLETAGFDLNSDEIAGYVTIDATFNLNALAIGFGLENIEYEPGQFPGLIYRLDPPEMAVVIFRDGVLTTVDAPDEQAVNEGLRTTVDQIVELGLVEFYSTPTVNTTVDTIPISDELEAETS